MKPFRFLLMFALYFGLSIATSFFMVFVAQYFGQLLFLFVGMLLTFTYVFLFSWLYFRGVTGMPWRSRLEAIVVWMGLALILDFIILKFFYQKSISDLSMISVFGYSIQLLLLFTTAYMTTSERPRLSADSPNLMINSK